MCPQLYLSTSGMNVADWYSEHLTTGCRELCRRWSTPVLGDHAFRHPAAFSHPVLSASSVCFPIGGFIYIIIQEHNSLLISLTVISRNQCAPTARTDSLPSCVSRYLSSKEYALPGKIGCFGLFWSRFLKKNPFSCHTGYFFLYVGKKWGVHIQPKANFTIPVA